MVPPHQGSVLVIRLGGGGGVRVGIGETDLVGDGVEDEVEDLVGDGVEDEVEDLVGDGAGDDITGDRAKNGAEYLEGYAEGDGDWS